MNWNILVEEIKIHRFEIEFNIILDKLLHEEKE